MEKGFYKAETNRPLFFAPNRVEHKDFLLEKDQKDTYTYPIQGWYWFDTLVEAETFFISEGWVKPDEPTF